MLEGCPMQDWEDIDRKRKRSLFILCTSMTFAAFLILTVVNYFERDTAEIVLNLFVMSIIIFSLIALKTWNKDLVVYRVLHFFTSLIFFYAVMLGTGKASVLFWVMIMPLLFFYFFGKKEGLIWTSVFSSCVFLIAMTSSLLEIHIYSPVLIPRFAIVLFIVCIIGYGLESSRDTYSRLLKEKNESLMHEKELLERAMAEIKTLSGFIPICCHCKKVRNDEGYWQQVEIYMRERTNADFSHGICPECAERLYPEYQDAMKKPTIPE